MSVPKSIPTRLLLAILIVISPRIIFADPPKEDSLPILTDAAGNSIKLKKAKIVAGVRKLAWLTDKPEAFEMREFGSTTYKEGVVTLIPMSRIQGIKYDYDKETATVQVAGLEKPLQGPAKFVAINTITIAAEVDQGTSGVAELRFKGGLIKGGFQEVKFPGAKAPDAAPAKGELFSFLVHADGKGAQDTVATANNVQALYHFADGSEKLVPWLMFKTTLKVEIAKIQKMHVTAIHVKEKTAECELELKGGMKLSVTALPTATVDGKPATLVGLIGEVPAGWKVFPIHAFFDFQPGEMKVEEKKEAPKKELPKKESNDN